MHARTLLVALLVACWALPGAAQIQLEDAFPNLSFENPVAIEHAGDGSDRLYVVEQKGVLSVFDDEQETSVTTTFLDLQDRVSSGGELGLLGLAFHPDYETNGYFYVNYTTEGITDDAPYQSIIARFERSATNPLMADPSSEHVLLTLDQPLHNHNGGDLAFGPDGYLYATFGDGGGGQAHNAQDLTNLLGTIIRLDVDNPSDDRPYGIPSDNPFAGNDEGFREEIYAYGLRNPWRFSIDDETGNLWAGDVGEDAWEEVNLMASSTSPRLTARSTGSAGRRCRASPSRCQRPSRAWPSAAPTPSAKPPASPSSWRPAARRAWPSTTCSGGR